MTSASDVWERAVLSEASANDLVIHHIDGNPPNNEVANLVVGPAGSSSGVPWDGSASPTWAAIAMAHRRASLGLDELRGAMGFLVGDQPDLDKPYDYRRDRAALQEWLNAPIPSLTTVDAAHSHPMASTECWRCEVLEAVDDLGLCVRCKADLAP